MTYEPMHSAQAQSVSVKEKISFGFIGHHCRDITRSYFMNVYFILISESSPYVLSYRSIYN